METASVSPLETLVTFDVEESWKGVFEEPVVRNAYKLGSSCGGAFDEEKRYLVRAYSEQDDDVSLSADTQVCSPRSSGELSYRGKTLQGLGPAERAFPESVERDSAGSTPVGDMGRDTVPAVVVASGALLFVAAVGSLALWRWRHLS